MEVGEVSKIHTSLALQEIAFAQIIQTHVYTHGQRGSLLLFV